MKRITLFLATIATGTLLAASSSMSVGAIDIFSGSCGAGNDNAVCSARDDDFRALMNNIVSTLLVLIGIASVIMLIVGGFRYITSNGDASGVTSAKNTILYAIIGLVVAASAFAIVNFVLDRI